MEFDNEGNKQEQKSQKVTLNIADGEINRKFCVAWMRASYMLGTISHKMSMIKIILYALNVLVRTYKNTMTTKIVWGNSVQIL